MGLRYPAFVMDDKDDKLRPLTVQLFDIPECVAAAKDVWSAIPKAKNLLCKSLLKRNYFDLGVMVPLPSDMMEVDRYRGRLTRFIPVFHVELPEDMSGKILAHNKRCSESSATETSEAQRNSQELRHLALKVKGLMKELFGDSPEGFRSRNERSGTPSVR